MMTHSALDTKEILRERFRVYRTNLPPAKVAAKSASILERVEALPAVRAARTLHCYWPMVSRGEIDTRPLIRTLHQRGVTIVLPVVTSFADGAPAMMHRCYDGEDALCLNRWGVHEPFDTECVQPEALDAVIVPALGAGRNGHRIGHGQGYYDAFLAPLDIPTIALVYDVCLVDTVPAAPHDVRMSTIVTEHDVLDIPAAA
jgi:5-formyltetrahydrofolate cyclo-ligase